MGQGSGGAESLRGKALSVLRSFEGRTAARTAFDQDVLARTTRASKDSKLGTLMLLAEQLGAPLFPVNEGTFSTILGAMKLAGYRSAEAYIREARTRHIQLQHPLPDSLRLFFKDAERSVVRNRGAVKRAPVVCMVELAWSGAPHRWLQQLSAATGPMHPWRSFAVSLWWMLRGAELIGLTLQSVAYRREDKVAELRLGATKTDIEGRGRRQCFSCICPEHSGAGHLCPACAIREQIAVRLAMGAAGSDPLFCTPNGAQCQPAGLVSGWAGVCSCHIKA